MRIFAGLAGACALALLALSVAHGQQSTERSVNWERARQAISKYRPVIDNSGLVEVDAQISSSVDAEDLGALCQARKEAIVAARKKGTDALSMIVAGHDPITDEQRANVYRLLASVDSFEGKVNDAAKHFDAARDALAPYLKDYPDLSKKYAMLVEAAAVEHMRQGEVDNCLVMSTPDRCIFPLRAGGHHHDTAGVDAALKGFLEFLKLQPNDLEVRWLANLSTMILGRDEATLPTELRIPVSVFASPVKMPRFYDVGPAAKLGRFGMAGGTVVEDFDGDGLLDVVFSSVDFCQPLAFYRNRGDGTFEERYVAAGLANEIGGLNATVTDYNNDGKPDLFVMRGGWEIPMRNSLLRNNGDGTFTDVTKEAGLSSGEHATHSVSWADIDNDGWLDVFVGHELTPSQLFRNRGDGTFEDITAKAGVGASTFAKGTNFGDYDNDGYPDLYISNMFGDNLLYHNNRDGTFTEVAKTLHVEKPFASFPTWFFDYDNDGWLDIFVSSYVTSVEEFIKYFLHQPIQGEGLALYHNNHDGTFTDVSKQVGLGRVVPSMGSNFGDLDNDGYLDFYLGTGSPSFASLMPNIMFKNEGGRQFVDVTDATGTGHLQKGHGIAFADLDGDGNEDVVLNTGGAVQGDKYDEALFHNPGGFGNHWLEVRLHGVKTNRLAIGAKITITLDGSGTPSPIRYREVTSGGSFGASPLLQHIGVGKAKVVKTVEIKWPVSGTTQVFHDVPVDTRIDITELADSFKTVPIPRFTLGGDSK